MVIRAESHHKKKKKHKKIVIWISLIKSPRCCAHNEQLRHQVWIFRFSDLATHLVRLVGRHFVHHFQPLPRRLLLHIDQGHSTRIHVVVNKVMWEPEHIHPGVSAALWCERLPTWNAINISRIKNVTWDVASLMLLQCREDVLVSFLNIYLV